MPCVCIYVGLTHRIVLQRGEAPAQSHLYHKRSSCCWCCHRTLLTVAGSWAGREVERITHLQAESACLAATVSIKETEKRKEKDRLPGISQWQHYYTHMYYIMEAFQHWQLQWHDNLDRIKWLTHRRWDVTAGGQAAASALRHRARACRHWHRASWEKNNPKHPLSYQVHNPLSLKLLTEFVFLTFFDVRHLIQKGMAEECVYK